MITFLPMITNLKRSSDDSIVEVYQVNIGKDAMEKLSMADQKKFNSYHTEQYELQKSIV